MRSTFILIFCFAVSSFNISAQEKKVTFRGGAGYYLDVYTFDSGQTLWLEGGYLFNTGFHMNTRVSYASTHWKMDRGFFKGDDNMDVRLKADIVFSKPIKIGNRSVLEPGVGFLIRRFYGFYPLVEVIGNQLWVDFGSQTFDDLGFTMTLDYNYRFDSGFFMGLRIDSYTIWQMGFEGLTITPLFGFSF